MYKNFLENKENNKIYYKNTVTFLNPKILVFHDLHKTIVKFASATKTLSNILITTVIKVKNA